MATKPILFNADMVRAILNGQKTVTRRIMKPQPLEGVREMYQSTSRGRTVWRSPGEHVWCEVPAPFHPGDILWVRETWAKSMSGTFMYKADGKAIMVERWHPSIHMPREAARIFLRVTDVRVERLQEISYTELVAEGVIPLGHLPGGCKCSAYTDGCMDGPCVNRDNYEFWRYATPFIKLWDRTVNPADRDTFGWDADPWVWVIGFERIKRAEECDVCG